MPELPDVEIFKKEAEKASRAKVTACEIRDASFVKVSKKELEKHVKGKKLNRIQRKGKNLYLGTSDHHAVALHFGMTGTLEYEPSKKEASKYMKCSFELDNNHRLVYASKRKLGSIKLIEDLEKHMEREDLGPDALEIKETDFLELLKNSSAMIKSFLTDQSQIAGIGNVYGDEILFQAHIHPRQKASTLTGHQGKKLYKQMQKVLKTAIDKQADVSRFPSSWLSGRRKAGEKCPGCKGEIEKVKISGRTGYFCPECQKESQ
ncbi:MAG: DNA-formamidopyrimidine glycosylase family protein [Bacteroidales bacterium]